MSTVGVGAGLALVLQHRLRNALGQIIVLCGDLAVLVAGEHAVGSIGRTHIHVCSLPSTAFAISSMLECPLDRGQSLQRIIAHRIVRLNEFDGSL